MEFFDDDVFHIQRWRWEVTAAFTGIVRFDVVIDRTGMDV